MRKRSRRRKRKGVRENAQKMDSKNTTANTVSPRFVASLHHVFSILFFFVATDHTSIRRQRIPCLLNAETSRFHRNSHQQILLQFRFRLVDGHIDSIETRVGTWEDPHILVTVKGKVSNR